MTYWIGDIPALDLVLEPARRGEPITLADFTAAQTQVELRTFDGVLVPAVFTVTFDTDDIDDIDRVILTWPSASVFTIAGLHTLNVTLSGVAGSPRERLAPVYLVVQADDGWHTLDSSRIEWPDSDGLSDVQLFQVLELGRQQVAAYAPKLALNTRPPVNYRHAQLMQARNLLNAGRAEGEGEGEFVLRPFPLDWMVRQTLRPHQIIGVVA
jgi:hypothetical protein